jgi:hypothetical protein
MTVNTQATFTNDTINFAEDSKFIKNKTRKSFKFFSILATLIFASVPTQVMAAAQLSEHCQTNTSAGPLTYFAMAIRTTNKEGGEKQPTYGDCEQVVSGLKGAGYLVKDWKCQPRHGTCPEGGWGSCILAEFFVSPITTTGIGVPSVSFDKVGTKLKEIAGPTTCSIETPKRNDWVKLPSWHPLP